MNLIQLPEPKFDSGISIEKALQNRQSFREFRKEPLGIADISQLLWAAQGVTHDRYLRTVPSAGALYPLEVYVVVGKVEDLTPAVYKYKPTGHKLIRIIEGDKRVELYMAALGQPWVRDSALVLVFSAVYKRATIKYEQRGVRYVTIEVGLAAQNVYLQTVSLGLGTVFVGAFSDDKVREVLNIEEEEHPLCIMPIGKVKG